ncbi:MAG: hypothetical protein JXJ20_12225 [Anaerolineae bacterium]|nr:hypothetical protein [Anaerolineae bacterium]
MAEVREAPFLDAVDFGFDFDWLVVLRGLDLCADVERPPLAVFFLAIK